MTKKDLIEAVSQKAHLSKKAVTETVDLFLNEKIDFLKIPEIIEDQLNSHKSSDDFDLGDIIRIDSETRKGVLNNVEL